MNRCGKSDDAVWCGMQGAICFLAQKWPHLCEDGRLKEIPVG